MTDAVELELEGEWVDGKYGMQLQVEQWVGEYGTFILHSVAHFYLLVSLVQQVLLIIIMIVPAMAAPVSGSL